VEPERQLVDPVVALQFRLRVWKNKVHEITYALSPFPSFRLWKYEGD
jgi:hypothetical protein